MTFSTQFWMVIINLLLNFSFEINPKMFGEKTNK